MEINVKQAIRENWPMTIRAWCAALEINKLQQQMLEKYHRDYTGNRLGHPVNPNSKTPIWQLTYDEFRKLQEYRAKRANNVRGQDKKKRKSRLVSDKSC